MNSQLQNDDSYAARRKLFKNIWDTAMKIGDTDFMSKPKVIKTLRVDDVDKNTTKKKKQRIKNLRTVCRKILDFCDRQDAEEIYYNRTTNEGMKVGVKGSADRKGSHNPKRRLNSNEVRALEDKTDTFSIKTSHIKTLQVKKSPIKKKHKTKKVRNVIPDYMVVAKAHLENANNLQQADTNVIKKVIKVKRKKKKIIRRITTINTTT